MTDTNRNDDRLVRALRTSLKETDRLREQNRRLELAPREPVAVVGMSCRYPGGVTGPDDLWTLIAERGEGISSFPTDRGWDIENLYDPTRLRPDTTYVAEGGFLSGAGEFDPQFFGIGPREADIMDPQQRLLLEGAWEAVEDAGIDPTSLQGSRTGVFAGVMYHDYVGSFGSGSVVSGRVSYTLGLEGPTLTVDTACSSSLVAVHLAAQSLRSGESTLALAGGVTVMATPDTFVEFSRQGGLAADARCRSFSDDAAGTVWSEGVGVLVLERLSDAVRNGHRIHGIVSGSAVNSDGASNGLTAPNGPSQQRVIRAALDSAGLAPSDVQVVEAHGTGTVLGDPIEAQALLAAYGQDRDAPLRLGTVKSNLGHTQAAAGVAGIIKLLLSLRHEQIAPTINVSVPSSKVDWDAGSVELATEATPWPISDVPRRGAVSSFGISGTNAHVIVEEYRGDPTRSIENLRGTEPTAVAPVVPAAPVALWPVSGTSPQHVRAQAGRLADALESSTASDADIGRALASSRAAHRHRAVAVGADRAAVIAGLRDITTGDRQSGRVHRGKTAFLFSGQGSQHPGMGRDLYRDHPVFASTVDDLCVHLGDVRDVMFGDDAELLSRSGFAQPSIFVFEVALFRLLVSWGIGPDVLAGHSVGEIAAAHVAGVFSAADACALVSARARLMQALPAGGAMVSIRASEDDVRARLSGTVDIAAVNGPTSVVISGADADVARVAELFDKTRRLTVSHAFHSPLMGPMLDDFAAVARTLTYHEPTIPIVSEMPGRLPGEDTASADYWVRHVRATVRFADTVRTLRERGVTRYLELGPDSVLTPMIGECVDDDGVLAVGTTRAGQPESTTVAAAVGALHVSGRSPDWAALLGGTGVRVDLPSTAFVHENYWVSADSEVDLRAAGLERTGHSILGAVSSLADTGALVFSGRVSVARVPWLGDHRVNGVVVVPAAALTDWILHAGDAVGTDAVDELVLEAPLTLDDTESRRIQVLVDPPCEQGARSVAVYTASSDNTDAADVVWIRHAAGRLSSGTPTSEVALTDWPPHDAEMLDVTDLYDRLAAGGLHYGDTFRGLRAAWRRGDELFAEIDPAVPPAADGVVLHPALLDAAFHVLGTVPGEVTRIPFALNDVRIVAAGATALRVRITPLDPTTYRVDLADVTGAPVGAIGRLAVRALENVSTTVDVDRWLYTHTWTPAGQSPNGTHDVRVVESPAGLTAAAVHDATTTVLAVLQDESEKPLVVVTRGAVAVAGEAAPDLAGAAVWGLVRSAQSENPGRFVLLDLEPGADIAVARTVDPAVETQIAVRDGVRYAPRLVRAQSEPSTVSWTGTVLLTGATGALGAVLARHLVTAHGVRSLVLPSRGGGGEALAAELTALGVSVRLAVCDVSDPEDVRRLVDTVDGLTAIVHAAGILDDGVVESLTPDRLDAVLAPKVDGALALHDATRHLALDAFVVFSSLAGILGGRGQGNYAAANAFLDALAAYRRTLGLPGLSLAWGPWESTGDRGMTSALSDADRNRLARSGFRDLTVDQGTALFDAALARHSESATFVPVRLDVPALRSRGNALPGALRSLVGAPARRDAATEAGGLAATLASATPAARAGLLLDLVRRRVADVLGFASGTDVESDRAFSELGFDSLGSVELRNTLGTDIGERLPATAVFDYPTPQALAGYLGTVLGDAVLGNTVGPEAVAPSSTRTENDPIVIVGMACRYPGGVSSPDELWQLIADGRDGITAFPEDRGWDVDDLYDPTGERPDTSSTRWGGFVHEAADFDPEFFGIAPREALTMDPQQRLLLEGSWEAIEHAGIDPTTLKGSNTGVFAGLMYHDYYRSFGNGSVVSGRVAYAFGLEGPTMTIDTACSSSLVAMHLAAQALRRGECSMALAGGVTVMSSPGTFVDFTRQRGLAPDGRSKSFSDDADGAGFAEGMGVLLLQRESDARRAGRRVWGVVAGSAVNSDGASNGLTAPNGPSQQRVIRAALADAGVTTSDVQVVEAHGTGTTLGDPIEAQAVIATYGDRTGDPVLLGSVKSNIGHTQAAAGVAGVIKVVMGMAHGVVPASLHVGVPSSKVEWGDGSVRVASESSVWVPGAGGVRRGGVSSFGISGTNAHVVIAEGDALPSNGIGTVNTGPVLWPLSARTPTALAAQAARLLMCHTGSPTDIARGLGTDRSAFAHRAVVIGSDAESFDSGLRALADGRSTITAVSGTARRDVRTAYLFTGQGAQWLGMGKALEEHDPVFQESFGRTVDLLDSALAELGATTDVRSVLHGTDENTLQRTMFAQAGLFAFEVAMYRSLEARGLTPDVLLGHSIGEIAAAHVAGVFSLEDAVTLVAARGAFMDALPAGGSMTSIRASADDVRPLLTGRAGFAAVNGPESVVVSGDTDAVNHVAAQFDKATALKVSHAFHSVLMDPMLAQFRDVVESLTLHDPTVPIVSAVTGAVAEPGALTDPEYWVQHVREPVLFADAVAASGAGRFVELGPAAVLSGLVPLTVPNARTIPLSKTPVSPSRSAGSTPATPVDPVSAFATGLAELHVDGFSPDWARLYPGERRVQLPTYPFERRRFWIDSDAGGAAAMPPAPPVADADTSELRSPDPEIRAAAAYDLVRERTAIVLGYDTVDSLTGDSAFLELGMDSVSAMDLRGALAAATELDISAGVVFDHATVARLADHLADLLGGRTEATEPDSESISALLRLAASTGDMAKGMELLNAVARIVPSFTGAHDSGDIADPVRLSSGEGPMLLCFASPMALGGAQQYARFAAHFRDRRDVVALSVPGFGNGEALPDSAAAAVEVFERQVHQVAGDRPFLLVGYSSGGQFAHATAAALERAGTPADGVVLIDTYIPGRDGNESLWQSMFDGMLGRESAFGRFGAFRLAAMGRYSDLILECLPTDLQTPVLFLRASDSFVDGATDWRASWSGEHELREVPGSTHFTILEEAAPTTAATLDDWLLPQPASR